MFRFLCCVVWLTLSSLCWAEEVQPQIIVKPPLDRFPAKLLGEYDVASGERVTGALIIGHSDLIAAIDGSGALTTWDVRTRAQSGMKQDLIHSTLVATPDEKGLVVFQKDKLLILDVKTLETVKEIPFPEFNFSDRRVSSVGKRVIIGTSTSDVLVIDLESGKVVSRQPRSSNYTNYVGLSADGKLGVNGGQANNQGPFTLARVWDIESGETRFTWNNETYGSCFGLWELPDGRWVGGGGGGLDVVLFKRSWEKERVVRLKHPGYRNTHSKDGSKAVFFSHEGIASVLDFTKPEPYLGSFPTEQDIESSVLNADATELLTASRQGVIRHWKLKYLTKPDELADANPAENSLFYQNIGDEPRLSAPDFFGHQQVVGHRSNIISLAAFPDSKHVLTCGFDNRIIIWDIETRKIVKLVQAKEGKAITLYFGSSVSPDGKTLLMSGGQSHNQFNLSLWDATELTSVQKFEGLTARAAEIAFSPNRKHCAAAGHNPDILVWDIESGKVVTRIPVQLGPNGLGVFDIAFSQDGQHIAASVGNSVSLWRVDSGQLAGTANFGQVQSIAFRPESTELAIECGRNLFFVETPNLKVIRSFPSSEHSKISISANGQRVASVGAANIQVWDLPNPEPVYTFSFPGHRWIFSKSTITPDGKTLLVGDGPRLTIIPLP